MCQSVIKKTINCDHSLTKCSKRLILLFLHLILQLSHCHKSLRTTDPLISKKYIIYYIYIYKPKENRNKNRENRENESLLYSIICVTHWSKSHLSPKCLWIECRITIFCIIFTLNSLADTKSKPFSKPTRRQSGLRIERFYRCVYRFEINHFIIVYEFVTHL